jgi:enoyl-CoA hydratase/carnithine racemase
MRLTTQQTNRPDQNNQINYYCNNNNLQGPAVGAGLCVALACDMRIVERTAPLAVTFSGLGISAGMGATHWIPALANHEKAALMLLTGKRITGEEAVAMGLAGEAVDGAEAGARRMRCFSSFFFFFS